MLHFQVRLPYLGRRKRCAYRNTKKHMKNKSFYVIIALLLVILVLRECTRPGKPLPPSVQANRDSISIKKGRVADLQARGETIVQRIAKDSIRHAEALQAKETRIQGLTKSLAAAIRKAPTIIRDTVFLIQDSIIVQQAAEIKLLKVNTDSLRINYASLLRIKDQELKVKDEIAGHMESINTELFRTLNKERRRGKVWKVAVPVSLVIGFLIGEEL